MSQNAQTEKVAMELPELPAILGKRSELRLADVHAPSGWSGEAARGANFPNPLPLNVEEQKGDNWCWAAVTIGIARLYGAPVESQQCRFVTKTFSMEPADRCCSDPPSEECDQPSSLNTALHSVGCYKRGGGPIPFGTIRSEIEDGNVVGVRLRRSNGSGHFMAIAGWRQSGGQDWLIIMDPANGSTKDLTVRSLEYSSEGEWTDTTFTRRPSADREVHAPALAPSGPLGG